MRVLKQESCFDSGDGNGDGGDDDDDGGDDGGDGDGMSMIVVMTMIGW